MDQPTDEERIASERPPDEDPSREPEGQRFEDYPLSRKEYLSVLVHFYRAEVSRSTSWRQRLDATTNWAVLTTAAMLSFTAASKDHPHIILLLSSLVVLAYLIIEARRFRYFEVYRARVRMLEENFLIPVLTRRLESPMGAWREAVAKDLDLPKYKTTMLEAIGFRMRRNYVFIFVILLGGWFVKLSMHPEFASSLGEFWSRMAVGPFPPWVVATCGLLFYASLVLVMWWARHVHGESPLDEIAGLERNLEEWKL